MNRNNVERFNEQAAKPLENHQYNKKARIEKGILSGALIVILIALLIIPKYEAYRENKSILADKVRYNLELPDKMTEETYLKQLKTIGEQLDETRNNLPEHMDTVSLYESMAKMAASAKVGLTSLEFGSADIQIDDRLGTRIDVDFLKNEEKVIAGPDGKYLTTCEFAVVCSGSDQTFMAFLNELNQCSPVICVVSYEIEKGPADEKQMRLKLESYGIQEDTPANEENAAVYPQ
ncbi:hypothetical protein [Acetobacterium sp.]|uniref:hypothetical protein n=1 Tax=Acetobacterium sp. TaxID=1872094 RepID=UPI0035935CEF